MLPSTSQATNVTELGSDAASVSLHDCSRLSTHKPSRRVSGKMPLYVVRQLAT
jgi:hypothetical protein